MPNAWDATSGEVYEGRKASLAEIFALTDFFYDHPLVKGQFHPAVHRALKSLVKAEARVAHMRGIPVWIVAIMRDGIVCGGFLIGRRGTIFRASLPRHSSRPEAISGLARAFREVQQIHPSANFSFWTTSQKIARWAMKEGFNDTLQRKYLVHRNHFGIEYSHIASSRTKGRPSTELALYASVREAK